MIEQQYILQQYLELSDEPNIIRGATNHDLDEIKRALAVNPDCINETERNVGVTALHIAAFDGNYEIVDFLCGQPGIDITIADNLGRTASWAAHTIGRDDIHQRIRKVLALIAEEVEQKEDDTHGGNVTPFRPRPPSI